MELYLEFKIYDILSSLVHGVICLGTAMQLWGISFIDYGAVYFISLSFCIGYLINTLGSLIQRFLFWTFGGTPTTQMLKNRKGKTYSGIANVRFYFTEELLKELKLELDDTASDDKLSERMQQVARESNNSRIKDFNCSYAFSRSFIVSSAIISIMIISRIPYFWQTYLTLGIPAICYLRCRNRAFHYAKEVATEYLNTRRKNDNEIK